MSSIIQKIRPHTATALKAALGIGLCIWLGRKSGLTGEGFMQAVDALLGSPAYLLAIVFPLAATGLMTLRWQTLLGNCGHNCSFSYLFRLNLIAQFLGIFAPAGIAGDIVRGNYLGKSDHEVPVSRVIGTIGTDRFIGLFGVLVISSIGCLFFLLNYPADQFNAEVRMGMQILPIITAIALVILFGITLHPVNMLCKKLISKHVPWFMIMNTLTEILQCLNSPRVLLKTLLLSVSVQACNAAVIAVLCNLIAPTIPFVSAWLTGGMGLLGAVVPVTPNGLGTTEGIYCLLLGGLGAANCMAIGLLGRTLNYSVYIAVGYPLFVFFKNRAHESA